MSTNSGFDLMYGNVQRGKEARWVTCEYCGRSYRTTYVDVYPCPRCGRIMQERKEETT